MKNVKFVRPVIAGVATLHLVALAALAVPCYELQWISTYQVTPMNSAICTTSGYTECPKHVLCMPGTKDKNVTPIVTTNVACRSYGPGTWVSPPGICVGGFPTLPSMLVAVPNQDCNGGC